MLVGCDWWFSIRIFFVAEKPSSKNLHGCKFWQLTLVSRSIPNSVGWFLKDSRRRKASSLKKKPARCFESSHDQCMLRFGSYLLRFHLDSDWSRNNKHSRNFLYCSRFYGSEFCDFFFCVQEWLTHLINNNYCCSYSCRLCKKNDNDDDSDDDDDDCDADDDVQTLHDKKWKTKIKNVVLQMVMY